MNDKIRYSLKRHRRENPLQTAVVAQYENGRTEAEILAAREWLAKTHKLGEAWLGLSQSSVNRWLRKAREEDWPDLEIRHLLARRKQKPGVYTNWVAEGYVEYMHPKYGALNRRTGTWIKPRAEVYWPIDKNTGLGGSEWISLAELHQWFRYSYREIVALWQGQETKRREVDTLPRVREIVASLQEFNASHPEFYEGKPPSWTTIWRGLKNYRFDIEGEIGPRWPPPRE